MSCCTRISLIRMRLDHLLMYGFVFISCIYRNANEKKSESQPIMPSGYNNAKPIYRHIVRFMDGAGTKFNSDTNSNSNSFINKVKTIDSKRSHFTQLYKLIRTCFGFELNVPHLIDCPSTTISARM